MTHAIAQLAELVEVQFRAAQANFAQQNHATQDLRRRIGDLRTKRAAMAAEDANPRQMQHWVRWWEQEMARLNTALAARLADIEPARARLKTLHGQRQAIAELMRAEQIQRKKSRSKREARDLLEQILLAGDHTS